MSFISIFVGVHRKLLITAVDRHVLPASRNFWWSVLAKGGETHMCAVQEGEPEFDEAVEAAREGLKQTVVKVLQTQAD